MPCNDDCRIPLAEAALCAIMKVLVERDQMRSIALDVNWQEAGITEDELYRWWIEHKLADGKPRVW